MSMIYLATLIVCSPFAFPCPLIIVWNDLKSVALGDVNFTGK